MIKTGMTQASKLAFMQGKHLTSHNYKIALFTSAASIDPNTTSYIGLSNEVVGTGYTTGGLLLTNYSATLVTSTPVAVSITRSGAVATVTHNNHGFYNGQAIIIAGCTQTEYNGTQIITVVNANSYTFAVTGTPATPATGSPTDSYKAAILDWDDAVWTAATITARGALIYNDSLAGKDAIAAWEFTVGGVGTDITSTNGNFTATLPAAAAETALIVIL